MSREAEIEADLPVTHIREHVPMLLMVVTRATIVVVLEVMMARVIGVSKGPLSHKAFKVARQPVLLIVEDLPSI